MRLISRSTRKTLNYSFFWINLVIAFILAYGGSYLSVISLFVSFFCWCAYKYKDKLEDSLKNIDEKK